MAHDFAKNRPASSGSKRSQTRQTSSKGSAVSHHWGWYFSGVLSGLLIASVVYLGVLKPAVTQPQATNAEVILDPVLDEGADPDFDFYDYLAETEVQVDVVPVAIIVEIDEEEENPVNYLLHAGSFQVRQNAEGRLAKVILLNLEAAIVSVPDSGEVTHRVQVGPFSGRNKAENAKDLLANNNIDTIVLQMR